MNRNICLFLITDFDRPFVSQLKMQDRLGYGIECEIFRTGLIRPWRSQWDLLVKIICTCDSLWWLNCVKIYFITIFVFEQDCKFSTQIKYCSIFPQKHKMTLLIFACRSIAGLRYTFCPLSGSWSIHTHPVPYIGPDTPQDCQHYYAQFCQMSPKT